MDRELMGSKGQDERKEASVLGERFVQFDRSDSSLRGGSFNDMRRETPPRFQSKTLRELSSREAKLRPWLLGGLVLSFLISLLALFGWWRDITILKTLLPGRPDMKANTAVGILLLTVAIALSRGARVSLPRSWMVRGIAGFVTGFAFLTLIEYAFDINLWIDQLLFADSNRSGHSPPGRFAPTTAANFILLGTALILDSLKRPLVKVSQALFLICLLISLQSFFGDAFGLAELLGLSLFIPMAIHTSLSFILLSVAFLGVRLHEGYLERFSADTPSASMARRLLLAIVFLLPILKAVALLGAQAGFYSEAFSSFLHVTGSMAFTAIIVFATSGALLEREVEREQSRKRERAAYRAAEAERDKLHTVFSQAPTHVDMYRGPNHIFEIVHPLTLRLTGRADIRGLRANEAFPDLKRSGILKAMDDVYATGNSFFGREMALRAVDFSGRQIERFFNISLQAWRGSSGQIEGVIAFCVDVTDQVRARHIIERSREEVRRHADQLKLVTDALPSLISYIGRDRRYQVVNEAYQKWYGHPKNYFLGKTILEAPTEKMLSTGTFESYLERVLEGEMVNFQSKVINCHGAELFVETTLIPDKDENEFTRGFVVLRTDITQSQQAQEELRRAKEEAEHASLAKSQFLANMSHEIRTPLGVILGFSDLAIESLHQPAEARGYLSSIRRNAGELSKLLGEILDLSKVEANKLDTEKIRFPLQPIVDEVRTLLDVQARAKGIDLQFRYQGRPPTFIESDPTRLRQILINLVGNAIKFTKEGHVHVQVVTEVPSTDGENVFVRFEVEDTGIGISADQIERLFKPFSQADSSMTRKFGGTGLGLMLSRQLAIALGGDLELKESRIGSGSVFVARLCGGPLLDDTFCEIASVTSASDAADEPGQGARYGKTESPRLPSLHGLKVLVVEDSIENQILVSRYLKSSGAWIEIAGNGEEGVQKVFSGAYDVVLMDIQMPIMDGFRATTLLREKGFTQPIFALTAHAFQEERDRALRSGFSGYLTKPINKVQLLQALEDVRLAMHAEEREARALSDYASRSLTGLVH